MALDWYFWSRIAVLIGLFASHVADIGVTYPDTEPVVLRFHIFTLFLSVLALCIPCTGYFLDITIALCDSGIFGITVGALVAVQHFAGHDLSVFVPVDVVLIIGLFACDILIILDRKLIYHDTMDNERPHGPTDNTINAATTTLTLFRRSTAHSPIPQTPDDIEANQTHHNSIVGSSRRGSDAEPFGQLKISSPAVRADSVAKYVFTANETTMRVDGFKVNLSKLPPLVEPDSNWSFFNNLQWSDFRNVTHLIDSSSCHIYTANWRDHEKPVILKLIKLERMSSALSMSEFEAEACILSRVRHPHIISLLGAGNNPRPFLVLELLEGGTLGHTLGVKTEQTTDIGKCPPRSFTFVETLAVALAMGNALHYLHEQWNDTIHVIHRDLKPDNIGWSENGVIKIFDFGLCAVVKSARPNNELTEAYKLTGNTGTLRYMAPEVALGKSYNQTVDVYSFAIIIWQIARGKVPFENLGRKAFLNKVVREGLRPPLDPAWPDSFKTLLIMCWHEDRLKRPSFGVVCMELEKILQEANEGQRQVTPGLLIQYLRTCGRILRLLRPLAVIACLLLIAVGIAYVEKPEAFEKGLLVLTTASSLLYLVCLSYWKTIVRVYISRERMFSDGATTTTSGGTNHINSSQQNSTSSTKDKGGNNNFSSALTNLRGTNGPLSKNDYQLAYRADQRDRESFNPIAQVTI
jgi:serine/threonine protein kinase